MGMPITIEIVDSQAAKKDLDEIFNYFHSVDQTFSTYKPTSEISRINRGEVKPNQFSSDMKLVLDLAEKTKHETDGYFEIGPKGSFDPSGIVKGWAIQKTADQLRAKGFQNFYLDVGGDIQTQGSNQRGQRWRVGIRNPFRKDQIVKIVAISNLAVATSGTYERGQHIYNPKNRHRPITDIVSLTVIGSNILDTDRFATAAFAMGRLGITFIEQLPGFEGYQIDRDGVATMTSHFEDFQLQKR